MINSLANDNFINGLRDKFLLTENYSVNKILLLLFSSNNYSIINEPLNSLIHNYKEIEYILKLKIPKIMNYFYNNKLKIHKILYDEDDVCNIFPNDKEVMEYFEKYKAKEEDLRKKEFSQSMDEKKRPSCGVGKFQTQMDLLLYAKGKGKIAVVLFKESTSQQRVAYCIHRSGRRR